MFGITLKNEQELIQQGFGIKLGEEEFRCVLKSKTNQNKEFEFIITKFGAYIFNRNKRLVLVQQLSDQGVLCFEFEEEKIKKERDRIRKSCLIKCLEACFFPNYKESLYFEVFFKAKEAQLFWMSENGNLSVVDTFTVSNTTF